MKKLAIAVFAAVLGLGLMVPEAEAARFGGGRSFGMQRQARPAPTAPTTAGKPAAAPAAATAPAAAAKPAGMSRFLGPLAGLAAGLGIAALLSHFGMGEGMANMLLILALVMAAVFVVRWLMSKRAPASGMQYAGADNVRPGNFNPAPARFEATGVPGGTHGAGATAAGSVAANIPTDFDVEGFVRQAKLSFVRLQAANDRGDMDDIREFTTPEMFAEIKMQLQERGGRAQETDVMQLNAELLEVVTEANRHIASVHFSGQLREEANAAPEAFSEVWHLAKPVDGSRGWNVAGIQQT
ncbi:MAG: Tim44-like domain-containing protein [Sulfuritalea sp.]|jgi:predicted lipid-binding transport protein (Tim44 family)|nr:Tim44-like domain-containing protein [Sulfuritalea sp.]